MRNIRVLAVDDNQQDLFLLRMQLNKAGVLLGSTIQCDEVDNADDAMHAVTTQRYDIVILDQQMPEVDGLQTFRELRALEASGVRRPPVIAYSNCDLAVFREECLREGIDEFAVKYMDAETLAETLRRLLVAK